MVPVAVASAERRSLSRSVRLTAPVEPLRRIGVTSQMTGTVLRLVVEEGDRVRAGDLMAELDTRETAAQLTRARAAAANASAAFRRASEMRDAQIITAAEFDQARAANDIAESDVRLWETRLGFGQIRAPAAGIVTAKLAEAGGAVSPNQRLFELADVSVMVVRVQVSELDVVQVTPGEAVTVMLDAYPDARIAGRVRRVFPAADATSRLVPVEIALGRAPAGVEVRPGFLARVELPVQSAAAAVAVPARAVAGTGESQFVFTVEADTVARRPVRTGLSADGWVQVVSGLSAGARVVTSGHSTIRPGVAVRVAEGVGAGPAADTGTT